MYSGVEKYALSNGAKNNLRIDLDHSLSEPCSQPEKLPIFQENRSSIFVRSSFSVYFQESAFFAKDVLCAEGQLDRSRIEDFRPFFLSFLEGDKLQYTFTNSQNFMALCFLFRCPRKEMAREGADGCLTHG